MGGDDRGRGRDQERGRGLNRGPARMVRIRGKTPVGVDRIRSVLKQVQGVLPGGLAPTASLDEAGQGLVLGGAPPTASADEAGQGAKEGVQGDLQGVLAPTAAAAQNAVGGQGQGAEERGQGVSTTLQSGSEPTAAFSTPAVAGQGAAAAVSSTAAAGGRENALDSASGSACASGGACSTITQGTAGDVRTLVRFNDQVTRSRAGDKGEGELRTTMCMLRQSIYKEMHLLFVCIVVGGVSAATRSQGDKAHAQSVNL